MTPTQTSDPALYWSEALAEELLNFLTKRLKCSEVAAEITHETFLRIHENAESNPPNNARAMAYRIAVNLANDYQRKIKVRSRFNAEIAPGFSADSYPSEIPGPEQIVMAQQRLQALQGALDELDAECRTAFLLQSIDGLTHHKIAARLGISRVKVHRHLMKALAHLALRVDHGH
ncbi:RNA polymerase sigma factor [Methyloglobulus sp.]|uniref:RNA polymerase sigma factor n=1 Tax=Methyloglobulus sp. TaxID=2518622 RepID=UPI003989B9FB